MHMLKKSFIATLFGMIVCLGLLVEPTFAWLAGRTEATVSAIRSGELKARLHWTDDLELRQWHDATQEAVFSSTGWAAGKSEIRYLKVSNPGALPFDYRLYLSPKGEYGPLAKAVRLYEAKGPTTKKIALADMDARLRIASITNGWLFSEGTLGANKEFIAAIALKINDTASASLADTTLGDGFVIRADVKQRHDGATYPSGSPTRFNNDDVEEPDSVEKFARVFKNTDKYLYRVGNANAVALSSLFEPVNANAKARSAGAAIESGAVSVTIEKLYPETNVAGTLTANAADWTKGTIQFTGTGPVKLTITDGEDCTPTVLTLEVVDAKNTTVPASATASNIVLLNDISNASFNVSGGYTFYGNGFTVALPTDHVIKAGSGFTGYITVLGDGGNLDNVQIVGPVYPERYIYRSQSESGETCSYFKNSVIVRSGDCKISNSYISGSRAAVCISAGADSNVTIENTELSGGVFANLEIKNAESVTLRNVTTVQKELVDSYGMNKRMMGLGVVVDDPNGDTGVYIEGTFNQYNWLSEEQWNAFVPSGYASAFPKFFTDETTYGKYWHYLDGSADPHVNMGVIYINTYDGSYLHDNRPEGSTSYDFTEVSLGNVEGGVYTVENSSSTLLSDAMMNAPAYVSHAQGVPRPIISYGFNNSSQYVAKGDGVSNYLYYDANDGLVHIGVSSKATSFDALNGVSLAGWNGAISVSGTGFVDGERTFTSADKGNGTLTYSVTLDTFYEPNGVKSGKTVTYTYELGYAVEAAEWKTATISVTPGAPYWYKGGTSMDPDYGACLPVYSGITIVDYEEDGTEVRVVTNSDGKTKLDNVTYEVTRNSSPSFAEGQADVTDKDGINYIRTTKLANNKQNSSYTVKFSYVGRNGTTVSTTADYSLTANTEELPSESSSGGGGTGCVTPDTLITLADGSQVMVKDLKGDEELLVWNFFTGKAEASPLLYVDKDPAMEYEVIHLTFSDGTVVKVISEHGFYDVDENKYVYLDRDAGKYVGHRFIKSGQTVALAKVELKREVTEALSPVSYGHLCCYVNGMLSMPGGIDGMFNYFDVDPATMKYDAAAMQADIEKYGIFTYEEFAKLFYPSEFMYNAIGARYVNVTIGKGLTTVEKLKVLSDRYSKFFTK